MRRRDHGGYWEELSSSIWLQFLVADLAIHSIEVITYKLPTQKRHNFLVRNSQHRELRSHVLLAPIRSLHFPPPTVDRCHLGCAADSSFATEWDGDVLFGCALAVWINRPAFGCRWFSLAVVACCSVDWFVGSLLGCKLGWLVVLHWVLAVCWLIFDSLIGCHVIGCMIIIVCGCWGCHCCWCCSCCRCCMISSEVCSNNFNVFLICRCCLTPASNRMPMCCVVDTFKLNRSQSWESKGIRTIIKRYKRTVIDRRRWSTCTSPSFPILALQLDQELLDLLKRESWKDR